MSINFITYPSCQSHTNQKNEKEQNPTVFSHAVRINQDETLFFDDAEKDEQNSPLFNYVA